MGAASPVADPSSPTFEVPSTPKDIDCEAQLALVTSTDSPFAPSSAAASSSPGAGSSASSLFDNLSPPRVRLPTPFGTDTDDARATPSPVTAAASSSPRVRASSLSAGRDEARTKEDGFWARAERRRESRPDFGMRSYAQAEIRGFYFFRCSEPFQELTLKYVPQARGGSEAFEFR